MKTWLQRPATTRVHIALPYNPFSRNQVYSLSYVEDHDGYAFLAFLAEDEIIQNLPNVGDHGGVEGIILTVEFRFTLHTPKLHVCCFLAHS
jgi:hypothetical protein